MGKDIQPGTYRTRVGSANCYFSRLSGFSGELKDILANENTDDPVIVTVAPGDAGFKSERCGTWTQDLSPITKSKTSFGDGMFFVGSDIEPGTYRNTGGENCYYARLSGFSHGLHDIVANENADAPAIVRIDPRDVGFSSSRCGTWTKQY